ncbi:MAG: LacI family DNA-binding transcriptional regulator [Acidobacteriaceae bacterium]
MPKSAKTASRSLPGRGLPNSVDTPPRSVGLKTLAAHLGLSVATVSRVLTGAPAAKSIPKVTQDRVFAAAAEMKYRPNVVARSLRKRQSMTIGVMLPEVSEGYATLVLSGVEERLMEADYFYFVVSHHHRAETIERCQHMLLDRAVEGLIAIDTPLKHRSSVPTVTVSGHHEPEGVTNIMLDHNRAAALAIDHLHQLGHREIAFIKGQEFSSDTDARWEGIRLAMSARGLRIVPQLVARLEGDAPSHDPGYAATRRLLAAGKPFTALFAFNDVSAIGAIRAFREAGLSVPEDVSVVGFDDVQSAAYQNPALTTVRQPLHRMGMLAAAQVLEQIGPARLPAVQQIVVSPELVVRESTRPPRAGNAVSGKPFR